MRTPSPRRDFKGIYQECAQVCISLALCCTLRCGTHTDAACSLSVLVCVCTWRSSAVPRRAAPHQVLYQEIDYINEARNCARFKRNFRGTPWVRVPTVHWCVATECSGTQ